jgi:ABC-type glycerol-3-phosphate transport system substrate-binding protein
MDKFSQAKPGAPENQAESAVKLVFLVGALSDEEGYIRGQIERFNEEQLGKIVVTPHFTPPSQMWSQINEMIGSGNPPDIASLEYNAVATLWEAGNLIPLEEVGSFEWESFLDDAQQSNVFGGSHYGLPWQRFGCSPNYYNLSVIRKKLRFLDAAYLFLTYMVTDENQVQNFKELGWYPTTKEANRKLGLSCGSVNAIRMSPTQIAIVARSFEEVSPTFEKTFGKPLDWTNAVGIFAGEEEQIAGASSFADDLSTEQVTEEIVGKGLLIGALMVNQSAGSLPTGNFGVLLRADERCVFKCYLLEPDEGGGFQPVYEFKPDLFQQQPMTTQKSTVAAVQGSLCLCWNNGDWRTCICAF